MSPLPIPFNIALGVLDNTIKKRKETKGKQIRKEKVKLALFIDDNCLCRNSQLKKLELVSDYSKIIKYKLKEKKPKIQA